MWIRNNFRVEVYPVPHWKQDPLETEKLCHEIVKSIGRHVDDVNHIRVINDLVCSYCNTSYENSVNRDGFPECCDEAQQDWESINGSYHPG